MKNAQTKAFCCAGIMGISLCTVLMGISMTGTFATAFLKDSDVGSMSMDYKNAKNPVLAFFNGQWGEMLMVASSASMLLGIWFSGKRRLILPAIVGIAVMFVGMYSYNSVSLQITGATAMVFAHISNYSYRVSKLLKII